MTTKKSFDFLMRTSGYIDGDHQQFVIHLSAFVLENYYLVLSEEDFKKVPKTINQCMFMSFFDCFFLNSMTMLRQWNILLILLLILILVSSIQGCQIPDSTNECSQHGICQLTDHNTTYCECHNGYLGKTCQHEQKNRTMAFWLSLLLGPFGADRYYLEYYGLAALKMIMGSTVIIGLIVAICGLFRKNKDEISTRRISKRTEMAMDGFGGIALLFGICTGLFFVLGSAFFWLHDWISILLGELDDVHGYPLL